jgi:hypothetical protein
MELIPPFKEIEHTADLAFQLHAESIPALCQNAFTALAFHFPQLIQFKQEPPTLKEKIISTLNYALAKADAALGCPFKAVSHHGEIKEKDGLLSWEMIVDV